MKIAGNTRVISQTALEHFRESLSSKVHDPYSVLLRRNKLPMSLIDEAANPNTRKVCTATYIRSINLFFHFSVLILSKPNPSKTLSARKHSESDPDWMSAPLRSLERLRLTLLQGTRWQRKRCPKAVGAKTLSWGRADSFFSHRRTRARGAVRHISRTYLPERNLTTNLWGALQGYRLLRRCTPRPRCP